MWFKGTMGETGIDAPRGIDVEIPDVFFAMGLDTSGSYLGRVPVSFDASARRR